MCWRSGAGLGGDPEVGWRAAVDSLRPYSHALWQGLSPAEQRVSSAMRGRGGMCIGTGLRRKWRTAGRVDRRGAVEVLAGRIGAVRAVDSGSRSKFGGGGQALTEPAAESPSPALAGEGASRLCSIAPGRWGP